MAQAGVSAGGKQQRHCFWALLTSEQQQMRSAAVLELNWLIGFHTSAPEQQLYSGQGAVQQSCPQHGTAAS